MIISNAHNPNYADNLTHRYYLEGGDWHWMGTPEQIALGDALDSVMRCLLQPLGFSGKAFQLDTIEKGLAAMHQPDSVRDMAATMAQLEYHLTQAYLHYVIGQRFGFTHPVKLFGGNQYAIETEQPDSAFVDSAMHQLSSKQAMLDFIHAAETQDETYQQLKSLLQQDTDDVSRQRIICNMERLRWRNMRNPLSANRYLFVNIASQQLWAVRDDSVINMRVCYGKTTTKTPLLTSDINHIKLNPKWRVPYKIIRDEMSHHAGDSAYFARNNYYITNSKGEQIDPRNLTSAQLRSGRYAINQRSGAGNSLGRVLLYYPNKFSVYLHGTSSPGAFKRQRRAISHGCIRMERPFDIVEFLMNDADEWEVDQMRLWIDMQPKTERGRQYMKDNPEKPAITERNVALKSKVPVLIDYYTLYPNPETKVLETWDDPYGYDTIIYNAIKPYLP